MGGIFNHRKEAREPKLVALPMLSWRCWDRGDGRYAIAAETLEKDPETQEFYGATGTFSKTNYCKLELDVAIDRLERAFRQDIRFEENRDPGLTWYRSRAGWR